MNTTDKGLNKAERRKATADLKRKVRELMKQDLAWAMSRIDAMAECGCGLIEDHAKNDSNFRTPKNLICAIYQDLASPRQYGPMDNKADKKLIKHYYLYV